MPARIRELFGAGRGRVLVFCWLGWVFDFYDLILFAFVKPAIASDLGLTLPAIAWIDGVTLLAAAVGGFAFGRLADLRGRRKALSASILVYSAGAFATGFADGTGTLLVARVLTGLGVGGEWGVGHALVAETYPERLRGRAAGVLQAGSPVAMALAAAVGCFLAPEIGWRTCFWLSGLPAVLVFFARRAVPGDDRPPAAEASRWLDVLRGPYRRPGGALLLVLALHMTGFWCTYAWLPSHLMVGHGLAFVGAFQIAINTVHVVADVGFGVLADRFGLERTFVVFCLSFAAGLAAIALGIDSLDDDVLLLGFAIGAVGLGAGTWSCFGVLFARVYRPDLRATAASGFYNLSRGVQLATQPAMAALFVATASFAPALWIGAGCAVLSALAIRGVQVPARA